MSERLLTIDVEAELRKLAVGRLRSRAQIPVALARLAAAAGARRLAFRVGRRVMTMEHDGTAPTRQQAELLTTVLDRGRDDDLRHQALEQLEAEGLLDLLSVFALEGARVEVDLGSPAGLRLSYRPGRPPRVEKSGRERGLMLGITGAPRDAVGECRELLQHCRYAGFEVNLNGQRIDRGLFLEDALFAVHVHRERYEGVIGLPRRGLAAVTRLVVDGVLAREVWESPVDGAVYEAVVCGPAGGEAGALAMVHRWSDELMARAREAFGGLESSDRERVKQLLFRLVDHGAGIEAVAGVKLFTTLTGEDVPIESLQQAAAGGLLRAVGRQSRPERYQGLGPIFVLDEREREFVERHLGVLVREPPRSATGPGKLRQGLSRAAEGARQHIKRELGRLLGTGEVPAGELETAERRFLQALESAFRAGLPSGHAALAVAFVRGRFGGFRWLAADDGSERLLLPRRNPAVRAMVAAVAANPAALYPALMLLCDGQDAFGEERYGAAASLLTQANSGLP